MPLEAIKYRRGHLEVLDQLQLPHKTHYDDVFTVQDSFDAIKSMRVRGAPAIAIVAVLGLAVELQKKVDDDRVITEPKKYISDRLGYLVTSRPTAVNLADAAGKMKQLVAEGTGDSRSIIDRYIDAAEQMLEDDVATNRAIGDHGARWLATCVGDRRAGHNIITHCNTGSLASAGYGTALGVIRSLHAKSMLDRAYCTETRPYNQGSRLTAYELLHDKIPATLITDSMAASLMSSGFDGTGPNGMASSSENWHSNISAVVVGADRVAKNGDTANKIGTYSLALLAKAHGVRFLVAAPRTTIDLKTISGKDIKIEERAASEMVTISGPPVKGGKIQRDEAAVRVSIAAEGIEVWNPAFDVTPAHLIDGIVTEVGVAEKGNDGKFDLEEIMGRKFEQAVNGTH